MCCEETGAVGLGAGLGVNGTAGAFCTNAISGGGRELGHGSFLFPTQRIRWKASENSFDVSLLSRSKSDICQMTASRALSRPDLAKIGTASLAVI